MGRGQQIPHLSAMTYSELRSWNFWHEVMADAERQARAEVLALQGVKTTTTKRRSKRV